LELNLRVVIKAAVRLLRTPVVQEEGLLQRKIHKGEEAPGGEATAPTARLP
jgi:hypothetical protein